MSATAPILDATNVASEETNRVKGFLGTAGEMTSVAETIAPHSIEWVRSLSNEELLPLGERALSDIADDVLVLDEIRQRFRKTSQILGYNGWKEFVEKNSRYSVRTLQRKLAEKNGKDESKVNHRFEAPAWVKPKPVPESSELVKQLEQVNPALADRVRNGSLVPRPKPTPKKRNLAEKDYFARVGRGLASAFSNVDERLNELAHIKKSDWTPEAEEGIRCLILNLKEVSTKANEYAAKLKGVLRENGAGTADDITPVPEPAPASPAPVPLNEPKDIQPTAYESADAMIRAMLENIQNRFMKADDLAWNEAEKTTAAAVEKFGVDAVGRVLAANSSEYGGGGGGLDGWRDIFQEQADNFLYSELEKDQYAPILESMDEDAKAQRKQKRDDAKQRKNGKAKA